MTTKKQSSKEEKRETPSEVHERDQAKRRPEKPTITPDKHGESDENDENVGQRRSQDEPYVIPPPQDEVE